MNLLTYTQAAEFLGVNINTLYFWVRNGRVPHIRLSRRMVRFDPEELRRWIDEHRAGVGRSGAA